MLLKYFLMLLSLGLFFSDRTGGAGGDDDGGGDDDSNDDHAGGGSGDDDADDSGDDDGDDDDDAAEKLRIALQKERKAKRDAVKAQRALQRELDALRNGTGDDAGDTDKVEAAEQRAEAAERRLREATGRTAVMDAASEANAIDADVVYALVRDELEYDDDGEPTNVADVLEDLQERKPKLFRHSKGRGDGGAGGDTRVEVLPGVDRIRHAYEENAKKSKAGRR